jgi:hypothetical protein
MPPWHERCHECSEAQRELAREYVRAGERGDLVEVERLLGRGVPVDSGWSGCCGHYPIIIGACDRGDVELVEMLLDHGAEPEHDECAGQSANPIFSCALQRKFPMRPMTDGSRRTAEQNDAILTALLERSYVCDFVAMRLTPEQLAQLRGRPWWERGGQGQRFNDDDQRAMLIDAGVERFTANARLFEACAEACTLESAPFDARRALEAGADVRARDRTRGCSSALEVVLQYWSDWSRDEPHARGLEVIRVLLEHGAMVDGAEAVAALDECADLISMWGLDGEGDDAPLQRFPPAVVIRSAQVCHPYRVRCAWRKWRRIAPLVGRWRKALCALYDEVAHRPGNSAMCAAMDDFAACAAAGALASGKQDR